MKPKKVLKERNVFYVSLNKFKVKSRQSLSEWEKKGWIMTDPNGWFEWFIKYCEGRRLGEEDETQIGRWSSYISRHQKQISNNCKLDDYKCRPKQRQGLLQWSWDSKKERTADQHKRNVRKMAKMFNCELEDGWEEKVDKMYSKFSTESVKPYSSTNW